MKRMNLFWLLHGPLCVGCLILAVANNSPAQATSPVVNIEATDPVGSEIDPRMERPTDPAVFTVWRIGETHIDLPVYYAVSGSASNGIDYERLSGTVSIPAGSYAVKIVVDPIDDAIIEGTETVVITIEVPACIAIYPPPPECYVVGSSNRAGAQIRDSNFTKTNLPPNARITSPPDGAHFSGPTDITIETVTVDQDGYAPRVEFFANGDKIGEEEIVFIQAPPPGQPIHFSFVWSNVAAGSYTLTAKATDTDGAMSISDPVNIKVVEGSLTNLPPIVTIYARDSIASEGTNCFRWSGWSSDYGNTNCCFTNTATFVVRRSGATNADLTVHHAIGGSASNGVDYLELPDSVTIPAGARSARVTVAPIDDLLVEPIETVILALRLPTTTSNAPPYSIGWPGKAAAVIVDNDQPRPITCVLSDRCFHLWRPGTNGHCFRLETSTDLKDWIPVVTNFVTDGAIHFVDPEAYDFPHRFYRAVPETNPPPED